MAKTILISPGYNNAHWEFQWDSQYISPGVTEVSWELHSTGLTSGATWYATTGEFTCSYKDENGKVQTIVKNIGSDGSFAVKDKNGVAYINYANGKQTEGTFQCKHDENGAASFTAKFYIEKIYTAFDPPKETTGNYSLPTNMPYKKLNTPSNLQITPLLEPGETFNISWDPVGTNSYQTQYKWTDVNGNVLMDWKTYTRTVPNDTYRTSLTPRPRGAKLAVRVRTLSPGGENYHSDWSDSVKGGINQLPNAPTVTSDDYKVPNNGGSVTFEVTPGTDPDDPDDKQSREVYWATREDTQPEARKQCINNTLTEWFDDTGSLFFWTYDGRAFSEQYTKVTIEKNNPPTIKLSLEDSSQDLYLPGTVVASVEDSDDDPTAYRYTFGYGFTTNTQNEYQYYALVEDSEENSYQYGDLRSLLCDPSTGFGRGLEPFTNYDFIIWAKCWDGKDWSKRAELSLENKSTYSPKLSINTNESEFDNSLFHETIVVVTKNDIDEISIENCELATKPTINENKKTLKFSAEKVPYGQSIDRITVNKDTGWSFYIAVSLQKIDSLQAYLEKNILYDTTRFNPFLKEGHLKVSFPTITEDNLKRYGLTKNPETLYVENDDFGTSHDTNFFDNVYFIGNKMLWDSYSAKWINEEDKTVPVSMYIKDVFGENIQVDFEVDKSELPTPLELVSTDFTAKVEEDTDDISLDQWEFLVEEQTIKCHADVYALTEPEVTIYGEYGSTLIDSRPTLKEEIGEQSLDRWNCKFTKYSYDGKFDIPSIERDENLKIRININNSMSKYLTNKEGTVEVPLLTFINPIGYFTEIESLGEGKLEYEYVAQPGAKDATATLIQIKSRDGDIYDVDSNGDVKNFGFDGKDFLYLAPVLQTTISPQYREGPLESLKESKHSISKTTTAYTYTIVYNTVPTVAYRKNIVGLNCLSPEEVEEGQALLVVSQANNQRNKVVFQGSYDGTDHTVVLNVGTGEIKGLIIDCGSWT